MKATLSKTIFTSIIVSIVVFTTIILSVSNYGYKPFFNTSNETLAIFAPILGMCWSSLKIAFTVSPVLLIGYLILSSIDIFITKQKSYNDRYKNGYKEKGQR